MTSRYTGTYQTMVDLDDDDIVSAVDMDALRVNLEVLQYPNYEWNLWMAGATNISSTSWVLVSPTYTRTIESAGGLWDLAYHIPVGNSVVSGYWMFTIYVDGVNIGHPTYGIVGGTGNIAFQMVSARMQVQLDAGSHTVELYARVSAGTWVCKNDFYSLVFIGKES